MALSSIMISNLKKYNRFLFISDKTITVCSGKVDRPKVISIVKSENVVPENMGRDLTVKYENKKIKLLHTYFSILGTICYVGPLVFIPILKNAYVTAYKMVELYNILPEMFKEAPRTPSKAEDIIINILAWGFVLLVSSVGVLGILLTPFYPYMNL